MEGAERRSAHTIVFFRYRTERSRIFGSIKRPAAKVYIRGLNGDWAPCFMYIDSGADFTIIPYRLRPDVRFLKWTRLILSPLRYKNGVGDVAAVELSLAQEASDKAEKGEEVLPT